MLDVGPPAAAKMSTRQSEIKGNSGILFSIHHNGHSSLLPYSFASPSFHSITPQYLPAPLGAPELIWKVDCAARTHSGHGCHCFKFKKDRLRENERKGVKKAI